MTTIEWKKLEELELEHMHYGHHEHQYTQQMYNELQSWHELKVEFMKDYVDKWHIHKIPCRAVWIEM
jgi:phosphatidylinositol kinase/protein kinase (PI-3  family)